jgi:hypothetical protein
MRHACQPKRREHLEASALTVMERGRDRDERICLRVTAGVEVRRRPQMAAIRSVCGAAPSFLSERR